MLKIGCEIHSLKEWEGFTDERIASMDPNALDFWKRNKTKLLNEEKNNVTKSSDKNSTRWNKSEN